MISKRAVLVLAAVFCSAGCTALFLGNAVYGRLEAGATLAAIASSTATTSERTGSATTTLANSWSIATLRGIKTEIGTCGSGMVRLSWNEPSGSTGGGNYSYVLLRDQVDIYAGTERRFVDTGLQPGVTYTYVLIASVSGTQLMPVTMTADAPDVCEESDADVAATTTSADTTTATTTTTTSNETLRLESEIRHSSTSPRTETASSTTRTAVRETPVPVPPSVVRDLPLATTAPVAVPVLPEVAAKVKVLDATISSFAAAQAVGTVAEETASEDVALLFKDSNKDGISDYDAVHIFGMDPKATAPTTVVGKTVYTPEAKVLAGYDPTKKELVRIFPEEPSRSSVAPTKAYTVDSVALATSSTQSRLSFSGKALPNSFITIYIFSTPVVVTVKTDANGGWTYALDRELENGLHTVVTATVDTSGRILAKSQPFPFTKTAQAATLEAMPLPAEAARPTLLSGMNFYIVFGLSTLVFFLALVYVGIDARRREALQTADETPSGPPVS